MSTRPTLPVGESTGETAAPSLAFGAPVAGHGLPAESLAEILLRAAADPAAGIVFVRGDETEMRLSYAQLLEMARGRLAGLRAAGLTRGLLVPLVFTESIDFVVTFWACTLGGVVPVPMSSPSSYTQPNHGLRKLYEVWRQLGRPPILGDALVASRLPLADGFAEVEDAQDLTVLVSADLDRPGADQEPVSPGQGDEVAFVQYSSGSTGSPKGVCLSHRNLLANLEAIATAAHMKRADKFLSWMPYTHDMGLIGMHLVPLFNGADQVNLLPQSFVRRPMLWLEQIARHRAAITGSPNFGYRLLLDRLDGSLPDQLDLSCLRLIFNGAEPISMPTLREFVAALQPAGVPACAMLPVYGMAEACLAVTFTPVGSEPLVRCVDRRALARGGQVRIVADTDADALQVVDVGAPVPACNVRIVDDAGAVVPEGTVGHVQLSGLNVTRGYHDQLRSQGDAFDGEWLRSGDLGFMLQGRLSITGRMKDVVIVDGRKYFAYDIEACVESVRGVRAGKVVVCGWHDDQAGRERSALFVAVKVARGDPELTRGVLLAAWQQVNQTFSIALDHVVLVKKVPRTTSGKLQRYQLRQAFLDGVFDATTFDPEQLLQHANAAALTRQVESSAPDEAAQTPVQARLRTVWAQVLGCGAAGIALDQPFLRLGGTSIKAVQILGLVEQEFATRLDHAFLLECRTVAEMANYLERHLASADASHPSSWQPLAIAPAGDDDIAIIGMACRFPQAPTPEDFWDIVIGGVDAVTEVPRDRWNVDRYYRGGAPQAGHTNSRWGGFIDEPHAFDAEFFGIDPEEATIMDPQQRLFLQTTCEALERAGYAGAGSEGRCVGVYVGASHNNYMEHHLHGLDLAALQRFRSVEAMPAEQRDALLGEWKRRHGDPRPHPHTAVGNLINMIAGRTAHAFDLRGPCLVIDTACSSSLVAVHTACEGLRRGDCEMAVAGGVNLNLTPTPYLLFSRAGTLSPSGRCKAFDAHADGFVLGEGLGVAILKPLARARADGDNVLAVIKSSSVNNSGRSLGVMAPNPDGQRVAIAGAYAGRAALRPEQVQYVEAHGTGTAIGDPSELRALGQVFEGAAPGSCVVGSVKANIGHSLSAAGIAGLIKMVLALQHRRMPPSLHVTRPQPQLARADSPFRLLDAAADWPEPAEHPRRAAINSFGFGGTNCHMVLEAASSSNDPPAVEPPMHLLCLSAHSPAALHQRALDLARHLGTGPNLRATDVCHTLSAGRRHFGHRLAVVADGIEGLAGGLAIAVARQAGRPALALMFTGQGAQYPGMARRLYEGLPAFRRVVDECAAAFDPHLEVPLLETLYGADSSAEALAQTRLTQPAVFTIDYALGRLLLTLGVEPSCLLGHSVGEYVAACLADVMSLADAAAIVAARGRLINALPAGGGMLAVSDSQAALAPLLQPHAGRLWFAAHNGTQQVISGALDALAELQAQLVARGTPVHRLQVSHAFHTPMLAAVLDDYAQVLARATFRAPRIPVVSNLQGAWIDTQPLDAAHWLAHVTAPVCFEQSVRLAAERGVRLFIECGPDKTLAAIARASLGQGAAAAVLSTLDRRRDDWETLLTALARLYTEGLDLDLRPCAADADPRRVVLPTYPFARDRYGIVTCDDDEPAPPDILQPAPPVPSESRPPPPPAPETTPAVRANWREALRQQLAAITQTEASKIDMHRSFQDLGLDSVGAVQLGQGLAALTDALLPSTLLFEYQSPLALAEYLDTLDAHPMAGPPADAKEVLDTCAPRDTAERTPERTPQGTPQRTPEGIPVRTSEPDAGCTPECASDCAATPGRDHDIAIVGMACRIPGADTLEDYWSLLVEGRSVIREVRPDQWSVADYFGPAGQASHTSYSKWGGFLDKPYDFDPLFFGISPREAEVMDPQQRLFLEVAWEALQQSGHGGEFRTREIGVFVGCEYNHHGEHFVMNQRVEALSRRLAVTDWIQKLPAARRDHLNDMLTEVLQPAELIADAVAGQGTNSIAARLSHWLDLRGPNFVVNTACSSSLVALHLACASLRCGESKMAVAGATYLASTDSPFVFLSRLGALSPTGRCTPFDERADGMVIGEGVSAVVLKRLRDAVRDGDHIHAVIKGSAINNDGHSNGITAPNPRGQAEAIRKAYADAELSPDTVTYVECHGTGTPLGDPIEIDGMTQAFRSHTSRRNYCAIGSVKSTLGHMLSGSSLPALIKVVLSMQHRVIPPTLGFEKPNPRIDFKHSPFWVAAGAPQAWSVPDGGLLRAGVNAFGFGGSNCHVVLEEAPRRPAVAPSCATQLLLLSGRTEAVLQQVAARLLAALARHPDHQAAQVCYTMNSAQRELACKAALRVRDTADLRAKLAALVAGETGAGVELGSSRPRQVPSTFWVLDATGPFDPREFEGLSASFPELQRAVSDCDTALKSTVARGQVTVPRAGAEAIAAFAQQYALGRLLLACAVKPDAIVAEGAGILVGACLLGMLSLQDAVAALLLPAPGKAPTGAVTALPGHAARRRQLVIPGAVLQEGASDVDARLVDAAAAPRRLASADIGALARDGCLFVHIGGDTGLRARLGVDDAIGWADLPSATDARERLLALFGRLFVKGVRFDARPLAATGARRVPLPTYPFENKPYRCKPVARRSDAAASHLEPPIRALRAPQATMTDATPAAPLEAQPAPPAPLNGQLRPVRATTLTAAERDAAHDVLSTELSRIFRR